jgi:hypothetical protein
VRALQSAPKAARNIPEVEVENDEEWGQARSDGNDEAMKTDDVGEVEGVGCLGVCSRSEKTLVLIGHCMYDIKL